MTDWEGVHTCHDECPCHTGGRPAPDFLPVEEAVPRLGWYGYLLDLADRSAALPRQRLASETNESQEDR